MFKNKNKTQTKRRTKTSLEENQYRLYSLEINWYLFNKF